MFTTQANAIVNAVNCVGVMGKGVALEFKRRWPENYKQYKKICNAGELSPGKMFVFDNGDMFSEENPRYLINFPTKKHWREKSRLSYIEDGLDDFVVQLSKYNIKSVALPPLGCGNGGLPWEEVKSLMELKLSDIKDIEFFIYQPQESIPEPEYRSEPSKMTFERAVLVKTLCEFETYFGGSLTRISVQKIAYFLQDMGLQLGLKFARNKYGPYSDRLKDALYKMEQQNFIVGYSTDPSEISVTSGAYAKAVEFLEMGKFHLDYDEIIRRLGLLIEGYENPYGMELLATVHYLVKTENCESDQAVVQAVQEWNNRKGSQFVPASIGLAFNRLKEDQFIH